MGLIMDAKRYIMLGISRLLKRLVTLRCIREITNNSRLLKEPRRWKEN